MAEPPHVPRLPADLFPFVKGSTEPEEDAAAYDSIRALFDHRVKHYGGRPFVGEILHIDNDDRAEGSTYTYREVSDLVDKAMAWLHERIPRRTRSSKPIVVGYLGKNGLAYVVWDMALAKMGHVPLCMSSTLAPSAAAALMRNVGATFVLYFSDLASLGVEIATGCGAEPVVLLSSKELMALPRPADPKQHTSELSTSEEWEEPFSILHSSGSTGVPKHYTFRHGTMINSCFFGPDDDVLALVPMSHGYIRMGWLWALTHARVIWFHPPAAPLTPTNVLRALQVSKVQRLYAVPIVLNYLVPFASRLTHLAAVVSAGSPLSQATGDALVAQGVRVMTLYGQSEHTFSMSSERDFDRDKDWNYVRSLHPTLEPYFKHEQVDEGKFEFVLDGTYPILSRINREDGGLGTGDIFTPHPTRQGLWRYVGRTDDLIVHSTGHKTDPLPMEQLLSSSPLIKEALVVGEARAQAALLVIPEAKGSQDEIRSLIQEANASAPSHSRIIPELVAFLSPRDEFLHTAKQSIIRKATIRQYEDVITGLYEGQMPNGSELVDSPDKVPEEVSAILGKLFPMALDHTTEDFFALGMNSLLATQVRNALARTFKTIETLPQDVVFAHPSVDSLSSHIISAMGHGEALRELDPETMLKDAIGKLHWHQQNMTNGHRETITVLLTGVTGTIGSHILHQLCLLRRPLKVLCPVRATSPAEAVKRLSQSLAKRKLLAFGDIIHPGFSVQAFPFNGTWKSSADIVIHCAWPVNFNYTLSSFRPSIDGTVSLLNAYPHAHHVFLSSISVALRSSINPIPEAVLRDAPPADELGYAKSKWVGENLFAEAAGKGWNTTVIRIGQIAGDTTHGIWNETEAPPLLLQASLRMGLLPDRGPLGSETRWLPVDQAAWAVATLALEQGQGDGQVFNLLANTAMNHERVCEIFLKRLGATLPIVPYSHWVQQLAKHPQLPAAKLMSFWEKCEKEAPEKEFAMAGLKAALKSSGLGAVNFNVEDRLQGVDEAALIRTIDHWRATGFL